jgi:hypothetical protein
MQMKGSCERSFEKLQHMMVPNLNTVEQFIVGVSRCWDAFLADPDPTLAWRELAPVFAYMDVLGALCAFDAAFHVVQQHRLRALAFHDVDSVCVGLAEARLLCGLASLQRGNTRAASVALIGALSHRGIHAVLPPLARIAAILDLKGHRLPPWRDTPPQDSSAFSPLQASASQAGSVLPPRYRAQ